MARRRLRMAGGGRMGLDPPFSIDLDADTVLQGGNRRCDGYTSRDRGYHHTPPWIGFGTTPSGHEMRHTKMYDADVFKRQHWPGHCPPPRRGFYVLFPCMGFEHRRLSRVAKNSCWGHLIKKLGGAWFGCTVQPIIRFTQPVRQLLMTASWWLIVGELSRYSVVRDAGG